MLIDKLNSHECVVTINEEDLENVHSSLMYFQENIKNVSILTCEISNLVEFLGNVLYFKTETIRVMG